MAISFIEGVSITGTISTSGSITATSNSAVIQTPRISMESDGTLDWGQARDVGTLTWDTGYAYLKGQASKGVKIQVDNSTTALTFETNANATFAGDVTVGGGDITLSGTGRIQGVDTVSSGTDAANKTYVDNQISGVPQGTVTSVSGSAGITITGTATTTPTVKIDYDGGDNAILVATTATPVAGDTIWFSDASDDEIKKSTISNLPFGSGDMTSWNLTADSGGTATVTNGETVDIAGGTNISTSRSGETITITNGITNNNQLTNGAGYTTNTGTVTGTGSSGRVAVWSGTSALTSDSGILFNTGTNALTVGGNIISTSGDITVGGGDIFLEGTIKAISNSSTNGILLIGDVDGNDEITQIELKTQAAINIRLTDDTIDLNSSAINSPSSNTQTFFNGQNTRRQLKVNSSSSAYNGETIVLHSASTTAGKVYGKSNFAATWTEADADSDITTNLLAVATGSTSANGMLTRGVFYKASHGFTLGRPLYVSNTAGVLTNTAPSGAGDYVRVVGYAIDSSNIFFCPDNTWVQNAN
tara:strand:+ start:1340 stop:2935 length:1596 start_codon:yes stop_codon:yes gene_type:complete